MKSTLVRSEDFHASDAEMERQLRLLIIEHRMLVLEKQARLGKSHTISFAFRSVLLAIGCSTGLARRLFGIAVRLNHYLRRSTFSRSVPIKTMKERKTSVIVHRRYGFKGDH